MKNIRDLTGLKFHKLTVLAFHGVSKHKQAEWSCLCDCGNTSIILGHSLTSGHTKSCGCYKNHLDKAKIVKYGSENPAWKGGITPLNEAIRNLPEYKAWIQGVFERDNYTCFMCKQVGGKLQAHHIKHFSKIIKTEEISSIEKAKCSSSLWDHDNGITLCVNCHRNVHKKTSKFVWKKWGIEDWMELNSSYCFKRIMFRAGFECSLQYHEQKKETIYVESGYGILWLSNDGEPISYPTISINFEEKDILIEKIPIQRGDFFTIEPYTVHKIQAITELTTLEVSTPEVDDCIRVQDQWNRPNGRIESEHEI